MLLYEYNGGLYLNITNRCPTACVFCIKKEWGWKYRGDDLRLSDGEPLISKITEALDARFKKPEPFRELVFCGYGESTMRLDAMTAVAQHVRLHRRRLPLRLNTVGLGSLIHGRDISTDLALMLDQVSVSLNTADPVQWEALHRPAPPYREGGFEAVKTFITRCVETGLSTTVTAVERPDVDLQAVEAWASSAGAAFRLRPAL